MKVTCDVLKSQLGGPLMLVEVAKEMKDCGASDGNKIRQCPEEVHQQWLAFVFVGDT